MRFLWCVHSEREVAHSKHQGRIRFGDCRSGSRIIVTTCVHSFPSEHACTSEGLCTAQWEARVYCTSIGLCIAHREACVQRGVVSFTGYGLVWCSDHDALACLRAVLCTWQVCTSGNLRPPLFKVCMCCLIMLTWRKIRLDGWLLIYRQTDVGVALLSDLAPQLPGLGFRVLGFWGIKP